LLSILQYRRYREPWKRQYTLKSCSNLPMSSSPIFYFTCSSSQSSTNAP
jgi:hypothetical protein